MSHIVEFEVEHLAGREGVYTKKLNRDVNIFFGLNGSGKTSLLKILHAAMEEKAQALVKVPFTRAKITIYSRDWKKKFVYTLDKSKIVKSSLILKETKLRIKEFATTMDQVEDESDLRWKVEPPKPPNSARGWQHEYLPTTRLLEMGYALSPDMGVSIQNEDALDMHFELALKQYWSDFFGRIQASVGQLQEKALVDILNEVLTTRQTKSKISKSLDWETAYDEMVTFMKRQNPKAKPSSKKAFGKRYGESLLLRKVIDRIDRVEREIEAAVAPRTKLQNLIGRMFTGGKSIRFGETSLDILMESKKSIGLHALSSGEKHILYILIECLRADFSSIMIDEPEISMHVDWQNELVSAMRELNPKAQIIATTHSPEILADIDEAKIFRI